MSEERSELTEQRRRFLKSIAGAGSLSALSALSGCQSNDDTGQETDGTETGGTETGGDETVEAEPGKPVRTLKYELLGEADFPLRFEGGRLTARAWEELGLSIDATGVETGTLIDRMVERTWTDMMAMWFGPSGEYLDPNTQLSWWHTDGRNFWNWSNEEYDKLIDQQAQITDTEERQELVYRAQELWAEHHPGSGMFYGHRTNMYNNKRIESVNPIVGDALDCIWSRAYSELKDGVSTIRLGNPENLNNQNPIELVGDVNILWLNLMYDPLFRIDTDGNPIPWSVEEYEYENDTTILCKLREDTTWHDGETVTAEDVVFTYELTASVGGRYQSEAQLFESVEAPSEYEVRFKLKEPFAPLLTTVLSQIPIVPKHIWEDIDDPLSYANDEPIGSGPMQFNYHRIDEEASIVAFEDHFEPPTVGEELFVMHADLTAIYRSLEEEEIDMAVGPSPGPETIDRLGSMDHVTLVEQSAHGVGWTLYDTQEPPFDDPAFRKALNYARPSQDIVDIVFAGRASVINGPISPVLESWYNGDIEYTSGDVEAARAVLEEAGYSWDGDGRLLYPE